MSAVTSDQDTRVRPPADPQRTTQLPELKENRMLKSEYVRSRVKNLLAGRGRVKHDDLIRDASVLTDDGDPRWIGAALSNLSQDGEVQYPACDDDHSHDHDCTVEAVAR